MGLVAIHMELALIAMLMQDMVQLLEGMEKIMNQDTNATRPMKLNAIPLPVRFHRIIVKIEKKKFARNLLKWYLFLLKNKIAMTNTRRYASSRKDPSRSK